MAQSNPGASRGTLVVCAFLVLASVLAAFAVWYQWQQTRQCLGFFGPEVATAIQSSPIVEIWQLESDGTRFWRSHAQDISQAPGLVHLRRGLIEDGNYSWEDGQSRPAPERLPPEAWDIALSFSGGGAAPVVLAVDLDAPGSLTVVGRPGRVAMGRLHAGLGKWVRTTVRP